MYKDGEQPVTTSRAETRGACCRVTCAPQGREPRPEAPTPTEQPGEQALPPETADCVLKSRVSDLPAAYLTAHGVQREAPRTVLHPCQGVLRPPAGRSPPRLLGALPGGETQPHRCLSGRSYIPAPGSGTPGAPRKSLANATDRALGARGLVTSSARPSGFRLGVRSSGLQRA